MDNKTSGNSGSKSADLSAYLKLKPRLRRFVDAYIELGVGTKALRKIGFKGKRADCEAYRLLHIDGVQEAVAEREAEAIAEAGVTTLGILLELVRIAKFNPKMLLAPDGSLLPMKDWPDEAAAAIVGFDHEELFAGRGEGRAHIGNVLKPRAANKTEALKLLMQYKKMLTEKHELTGKDGEALKTGPTYVISREEAAKIGEDLDDKV